MIDGGRSSRRVYRLIKGVPIVIRTSCEISSLLIQRGLDSI